MLQGNLPDVFLDTDVAFDILSKREPHYRISVVLLQEAARGKIQLMLSESSLANLFYLCFEIYKIKNGKEKLSEFVSACVIVNGGKEVVLRSLGSAFKDKEDALQYFTAIKNKADYFVTRNKKDYLAKEAVLPVFTPNEFIQLW